ncbi:MAG: thioredoxin domain-containing protein [Peptococcaceae bacterium]|nr:thioredoxin domain-containing protein [Peptococcaceae bacterium]
MTQSTRVSNRLAQEKSPYLLQHAHNPVNWFPWGEEAFATAQAEDKPIFLSIGYSTCHWCHVMEKESFEDDDIARLLNNSFVSVKVDREERPDVDHLYMSVCIAMTGHGGWPLSLFLFPDRRPFFGGSYFPKNDRYGIPGFASLISQLADLWHTQRPLLEKQASIVVNHLSQEHSAAPAASPESVDAHSSRPQHRSGSSRDTSGTHEVSSPVFSQARATGAPFIRIAQNAYQSLANSFSEQYGGFGSAPKFPTPHKLSFLMRYIRLRISQNGPEDEIAAGRHMLAHTLESMAAGGIYDHVGGGFCRYSTDSKWLVPHFEKMLYDNALLARVYAEAGSFFKESDPEKSQRFSEITHEILRYVLREMLAPEGAFYTAQDADSEGVEGKYYVWTPQELEQILGLEGAALCALLFGVHEQGNFEGRNILNSIGRPLTQAQRQSITPSLDKLLAARARRVAPLRDDKILTSSNALMIGALSVAGRLMQDNSYINTAWHAGEFIWRHLRTPEGRLFSRYCQGESAHPASSDDYAYLLDGFLELYRATFEEVWLRRALELAHILIELFWDQDGGGLFLSAYDVDDILIRSKNFFDGAMPSGNAVAAKGFLQLSRLTGDSQWEEYVHGIIAAAEPEIHEASGSATVALAETALWLEDGGTEIVVVEADRAQVKSISMAAELHQEFLPFTVITLCGPGHEDISELAPFTTEYESLADQTSAFVCRNQHCSRPVTDSETLFELL